MMMKWALSLLPLAGKNGLFHSGQSRAQNMAQQRLPLSPVQQGKGGKIFL